MPEPVSDHIVTTPNADATYSAVDSDRSAEPWHKLSANSGKADLHTGQVTDAGFEDSPPWRQV